MHRIFGILTIFSFLVFFPVSSGAQGAGNASLAKVKAIKCTFPVKAVGTWGKDKPEGKVQPVNLVLDFHVINTDEGTAELKSESGIGNYDIIVRYAEGYLNFIQSFLNGPLHITTVLDKKTSAGKWKAVHSRHEYTDFALPGFTSSPEQYYGECEITE